MRFPPSLLDEIRARLPVSEVVGKRMRLQKAGREFKGLSPFNAEKTPSFFVNDQKGFFHDFSSGKHGDIFGFVMETEGLTFPEAVEKLAALAGVALPIATREAQEQEQRHRSLSEVVALAATFFRDALEGRAGAAARGYCESRGLHPALREQFGLGYALPERYALRDHLAAKGCALQEMVDAGLLVQGDDAAVAYDRFRDRLIFPIHDVKGRPIAFGGRALAKDAAAKYLNSPETALFHKGSVLYHHHGARKAAHARGTVIAVEGYVDVIAMVGAGFPHTVAPLGTALTPEQLALLWRMADEPVLCFDGDKAGRRAAYRAIDVALAMLEPGKSLRFALLPEGQDPDDLARFAGPAAITRLLDAAAPMADLLWSREVEAAPLDTPERRAALEKRLRDILAAIKDENLRRHYRAEMEVRLRAILPQPPGRAAQGRGHDTGPGWRAQSGREPRRPGAPMRSLPVRASESLARSALFARGGRASPREALILAAMLAHPELLAGHAEQLSDLEFAREDSRRLREALVDWAALRAEGALETPAAHLERRRLGEPLARINAAVHPGDRWCLDSSADPEAVKVILRQAMTLHHRASTLHNELSMAEAAFAVDGSEASLAWIRDLRLQLSALDGTQAEPEQGVRNRGSKPSE